MNELRRDYFTDRRVIVATERAKRPTDFVRPGTPEQPQNLESCPFCEGHEHLTPPSKATYFFENDILKHEPDVEGQARRSSWAARIIPNLFPATQARPPEVHSDQLMTASGVHEVLVESPDHYKQPQAMSDDEIKLLFKVYRDRFEDISKLPYIKYISEFRNYGKDAGASLAHPHSQIIAVPVVPRVIKEQYGFDYSEVIAREEHSARLVQASKHAVAFTPYASAYSYETWIFPRRHCKNILELTDEERDDLAVVTRDLLKRVKALLADPPYNYGFIQSLSDPLHMHLRIYPKLGIEAGFELNTGININSVPPEEAAKSLHDVTL
ncbi:galactose-1-phosphate uridylyltransferase [Methanocella arvoryzae]|uniref:Galactose-1-phosphate uridylyltransferase n=1 Tax=Methanocella arvoryzae (strain DSM 22066 / NBRC 105507 / MRE50) TaxID=351160 RepID=Q0W4T3_METAR|nr:DUF4921 family protein [Methanocella arvoryzae]CAJ36610.1 galactose-1-phosphate uridylyltransferase [Methanocella arvoryzae MRE50]